MMMGGHHQDNDPPGVVNFQTSTCRRCLRPITWTFDNDQDPYGFWRTELGEVCIPDPGDGDRYHAPQLEGPESP